MGINQQQSTVNKQPFFVNGGITPVDMTRHWQARIRAILQRMHQHRWILYVRIGGLFLFLQLVVDVFSNPDTFWGRVVNNAWLVSYLIVLNFVFFEYTVPFMKFTWKRILIIPFLLALHLGFYSFGLFAWRFIGIQLHIYTAYKFYTSIQSGVGEHFPYSVVSVILFGIMKYRYDYQTLQAMAQQLRIEKQEAELQYLKSQTNPHFLFNTLNNIYSLARDKSDLAPESILRLSKILRFMLYETSGEFISIEQELKIMNDYIALEQLRYDDSLRINVRHDVEDMNQAIPPLLLIPLVENAFKHGVSETRSQPFVDIYLSVHRRHVEFTVINSSDGSAPDEGIKENIGLSNLRRQLELLYTQYDVRVQQGERIFTATLLINLASHVKN